MKISILSHDLSTNAIVRLFPIASVLARKHSVQVIGPYYSGDAIYSPYKNEFSYQTFRGRGFSKPLFLLKELSSAIQGDVIYAFKPRLTSFGGGLAMKFKLSRPLILDVEDWDFGFWLSSFRENKQFVKKMQFVSNSLKSPASSFYAGPLSYLSSIADGVTVATSFLQNIFGGEKLIHGVDTNIFCPDYFDQKTLRTKYNLPLDEKLIIFCGNVTPHKGLEDLADALMLIPDPKVKLFLVGGSTHPTYLNILLDRFGNRARYIGYQPHNLMPELLTIADYVVLPQRKDLVAQAQIPGKLFEAMAMAKPVIATRVSDLPEILDDCGLLVNPGNPEQLAAAICSLAEDKAKATDLGLNGKKKCEQLYSWDAMEIVLDNVLKRF